MIAIVNQNDLQEVQKLDELANLIFNDMSDEEKLRYTRLASYTSLSSRELYLIKLFKDLSGSYVELEDRIKGMLNGKNL